MIHGGRGETPIFKLLHPAAGFEVFEIHFESEFVRHRLIILKKLFRKNYDNEYPTDFIEILMKCSSLSANQPITFLKKKTIYFYGIDRLKFTDSAKAGHAEKLKRYPIISMCSGCRALHPGLDPGPA
jgi:hypothetical protein